MSETQQRFIPKRACEGAESIDRGDECECPHPQCGVRVRYGVYDDLRDGFKAACRLNRQACDDSNYSLIKDLQQLLAKSEQARAEAEQQREVFRQGRDVVVGVLDAEKKAHDFTRVALVAQRKQWHGIYEAARRLYHRLGTDDADVMHIWSSVVIDPEPMTDAEIAHAVDLAKQHGWSLSGELPAAREAGGSTAVPTVSDGENIDTPQVTSHPPTEAP